MDRWLGSYVLYASRHQVDSPLRHENDELNLGDAGFGVYFGRNEVEQRLTFQAVADGELLARGDLSLVSNRSRSGKGLTSVLTSSATAATS